MLLECWIVGVLECARKDAPAGGIIMLPALGSLLSCRCVARFRVRQSFWLFAWDVNSMFLKKATHMRHLTSLTFILLLISACNNREPTQSNPPLASKQTTESTQ